MNENNLWILFSVKNTSYGIDSKNVLYIEILNEITSIADSPKYNPGVMESREEVIELIDLRALFGLGSYKDNQNELEPSSVIVTEINGQNKGLIVDKIIAVEEISQLNDTSTKETKILKSKFISEVVRRDNSENLVLIIDMNCFSEL